MTTDVPGSAVLPLLRAGAWYTSRDTAPVPGHESVDGRVCLAPEILVRGDAARLRVRLPSLPPLGWDTRVDVLHRAVGLFCRGEVPIEGWGQQDPDAFAAAMRRATGLPQVLVTRWSRMLSERLLAGLPDKPLDDDALTLVSLPANTFTCLESVLTAALTSAAVWIRPSRREPISSARLVGALIAAGWPAERLGYYPTAPGVLPALIRATTRQIVYGGESLAATVTRHHSLDLRGPGRSSVIVDPPALADPVPTARKIADLVASDSGRFCTNVGTIACLGDADPLAAALAALLDDVDLEPPDQRWPVAHSAPEDARRVAALVDKGLLAGGRRVTRRRLPVRAGEATFLPPTLIQVDDIDHPLLGRELPFPFAVVVGTDPAGAERVTEHSQFIYTSPFLAGA